MRRSETRIAVALLGVFVWLGGLYATIRGLIYETPGWFRWGVLAIILGVATFVIALNPLANRGSRK
jgi:fatty acid desaturase